MGTEEDVQRLRNDVADLYNYNKETQDRLARLEERSINRDEAINELKGSIKELKQELEAAIAGLSDKIGTLINAPAKRVEARWDSAVQTGITLIVAGVVGFLLAKVGLK